MRFSYVAAGAWAIFLGIGSIGSGGLFSFAVLSPLWILPLWLVHRSATKKQQQLKAYVAKFLTALGHNDQRLFYLSPISGSIGVDPGSRRIVLGDGRAVNAYPYTHVREWLTEEKTAGSTMVVGNGALLAATANLGAAHLARLQSGLVVRVRDTEKPEWLITMDRPTRSRWFEVLTQEINENGVGSGGVKMQ